MEDYLEECTILSCSAVFSGCCLPVCFCKLLLSCLKTLEKLIIEQRRINMTTSFHSAREGFCSKSGNDAFYTSKQIFSSCVSDVLLKKILQCLLMESMVV